MNYAHNGKVFSSAIKILFFILIALISTLNLYSFIKKINLEIFPFIELFLFFLIALICFLYNFLLGDYLKNAKKISIFEDYIKVGEVQISWESVIEINQLKNVYFVGIKFINPKNNKIENVVLLNKFKTEELFPVLKKEETKFVLQMKELKNHKT